MTFRTFRQDGTEVTKGDILVSRGESWIYQSTTHPRKIYATRNCCQRIHPNMISQEFYANVFNLGIWDDQHKEWTFSPEKSFTPKTN